MFTLLSGFAFIYFQLKSFFESLMRLKRYNQIVIIENIDKDTRQNVPSFQSVDVNVTNKQSNKADNRSDISSSPTPSTLSNGFCGEIVISIDATAH